MEIIFVAAMSENGVIGQNGRLPWHLPNDFKHFKKLTRGQHILMGRKTFDSLGRALPERHNLVLTKDRTLCAPDIEVVHSKEEVVNRNYETLMVIGGEEIFRLFLPECTKMYLTLVHTTITGDAYFPPHTGFVETMRETHESDERHQYAYTFIEYEKQ